MIWIARVAKVVAFYFIGFVVATAIAQAAESKSELFYNSCFNSYYSATIRKIPGVVPEKVRESGKKLCTAEKVRIEKTKSWDKVEMPVFAGCMKAAEFVFDYDLDETLRKKKIIALVSEQCASIGDR